MLFKFQIPSKISLKDMSKISSPDKPSWQHWNRALTLGPEIEPTELVFGLQLGHRIIGRFALGHFDLHQIRADSSVLIRLIIWDLSPY